MVFENSSCTMHDTENTASVVADSMVDMPSGVTSASGAKQKSTRRVDARLLAAQTALYNARHDPAIGAMLTEVGFGKTQMARGEALLQQALTQHKAVRDQYGAQYAATDRFYATWQAARQQYGRHLQLARMVLAADREAKIRLQLAGSRRTSFAGWLDQARHFYSNTLSTSAYGEMLTQVGISHDDLLAGQALVEDVASAKHIQERIRGEARHATRLRKAALDKLARWMVGFRAVARAALATKPRYLNKLGIQTSPHVLRRV